MYFPIIITLFYSFKDEIPITESSVNISVWYLTNHDVTEMWTPRPSTRHWVKTKRLRLAVVLLLTPTAILILYKSQCSWVMGLTWEMHKCKMYLLSNPRVTLMYDPCNKESHNIGYRHTCPVAAVVVVLESLLLLKTAKIVTMGKTKHGQTEKVMKLVCSGWISDIVFWEILTKIVNPIPDGIKNWAFWMGRGGFWIKPATSTTQEFA